MGAATKISMRALLIAGVFAVALLAAFVRGGEPSITFALENGLTLTVSSSAFYNGVPVPGSTWALKDLVPQADKFFNLANVLPGDSGRAGIGMQVGREPAWLCLDFKNLVKRTASGGFADGTEFFAWRDDGDGVFEVGEQPLFGTTTQSASIVLNEKTYTIADAAMGAPLTNASRHIGIAWCAGHLAVNLASAQISCAGRALGNAAQGDSFSVDVVIRAESARENPTLTCSGNGTSGRDRPPRPERPVPPERPPRPERPSR